MNGFITYGPDEEADYDIGTVATYECNPGFILIGVATRDCVEADDGTGVFDGVAPVCERKDCLPFEITYILHLDYLTDNRMIGLFVQRAGIISQPFISLHSNPFTLPIKYSHNTMGAHFPSISLHSNDIKL